MITYVFIIWLFNLAEYINSLLLLNTGRWWSIEVLHFRSAISQQIVDEEKCTFDKHHISNPQNVATSSIFMQICWWSRHPAVFWHQVWFLPGIPPQSSVFFKYFNKCILLPVHITQNLFVVMMIIMIFVITDGTAFRRHSSAREIKPGKCWMLEQFLGILFL